MATRIAMTIALLFVLIFFVFAIERAAHYEGAIHGVVDLQQR